MYPGHCHRATELYVNIDMMQEAQEQGLTAPGKPWSNHFKANVHSKVDYGQYWSHEGNKIAWQAAMYENYKNGFYEPMKNGQFGYNNNGALHSFWPGERWMLAAWSRLTWPQENTYFPYNNVPPDPPEIVTCDAKGQPPLAVITTVN